MKIKTYISGPIDANNYLIWDENTKDAVLIDCSDKREDIIKDVNDNGLNVKYILLTHGHFDHILGVNTMAKRLNAKVGIHINDSVMMNSVKEMCQMFGISPCEAQKYDFTVKDGDKIQFGTYEIKVIETPGHTKGGVCYLVEDKLFCGDTVFKNSYGRTDLPGGSYDEISNSIKNIIFKLDDNITIYTGHGPFTTVGYEKKFNEINR